MAKLCPRGKAAAKRKFKVYPSAYANMYASAVCSGKVTPGGKKRVKKAAGGVIAGARVAAPYVLKGAKALKKFIKRIKKTPNKNFKEDKSYTLDLPSKRNPKQKTYQRIEGGAKKKKEIIKKEKEKFNKNPENYRSPLKKGGIAKGCGRVMSNRRKTTKYI